MITAKIENCNNISSADIPLHEDYLNLLFAMNGTGKSTIARAIKLVSDNKDLSELMPFGGDTEPSCSISPKIENVMLFDEYYVDKFVFLASEVIHDAFEVFIKTPEYDEKLESINSSLNNLRVDVNENNDIVKIRSTGVQVLDRLKTTSSGQLRRSPFFKSLTETNKIFKLPPELQKFKPLVEKEYVVDWVGWKNEGSNYDDAQICPFCTTRLQPNYETEKVMFSSSYSKSNVKNVKEMLSLFESVKEYMDSDSLSKLTQCIREMNNAPEIITWLNRFFTDLNLLVTKIINIESFNSYNVRINNISLLDEQLKSLLIDMSDFQIFNNKKVQEIVTFINNKVNSLLKETERIKESVGQLNHLIISAKKLSVKDVNDFLQTAGINYEFELKEESENKTKAILRYISESKNSIEVEDDLKHHLSWGERNAFALVLFMHDALKQRPGLIILDDPISSFDSHKKYAIINRLFSPTKNSFFHKSVLMLTHDMQPLIDMLITNKPTGDYISARFVQNITGTITEQDIVEDDIRPLPAILSENTTNDSLNIVHRLACLRKLIDIFPKNSEQILSAYHLISSLFHVREKPTTGDERIELNKAQIESGETYIKQYICDFSYDHLLKNVFNRQSLLDCFNQEKHPYIRLQIVRIIIKAFDLKNKITDYPLIKYIDEQLHIENDYMFSLDFLKYDIIPDFVVPRCTEFVNNECKLC